MSTSGSLYCKIFLDASALESEIVNEIRRLADARIEGFTLHGRHALIDVRRNEEGRPERDSADPDDFLFYRFYLDVEPKDAESPLDYVRFVRDLLQGLRSKQWRAVPACDFEREL